MRISKCRNLTDKTEVFDVELVVFKKKLPFITVIIKNEEQLPLVYYHQSCSLRITSERLIFFTDKGNFIAISRSIVSATH